MNSRTLFSSGRVEEYLSSVEDTSIHDPTIEQGDFIEKADPRYIVLQGPPGTGKTVTLAHAILSRSYSLLSDRRFMRGLLVAPSNNAVDTTLRKVAEFRSVLENTEDCDILQSLDLMRISGRDPDEIQLPSGVEYVNYRTHEDRLDEMEMLFSGQKGFEVEGYLLFATPTGAYKIITSIFDEGANACFDLLSIDEASMLTMPKFLMAGASTTETAQILITGDHRQMPPVQKHNWDYEDRRTIEEVVPYLSTMDFFRLLSTDDGFGEDEFEEMEIPEGADIPICRLSKTHRCHKVLAGILKDLFYIKDGIRFESDEEELLTVKSGYGSRGMRTILDPSAPVVLIVHNERESQQSNRFEASIIESIIQGIELGEVDEDSQEVGVVTPHNAQRGRLANSLSRLPDAEYISVNTVERFQGEERDAIIFSTTESDPDYIRRASDFILSPHRLNVSLSRMQKKLVIVASESLINFIPSDSDQYENARLWKQLLREMKHLGGEEPDWSDDLEALIGEEPPVDPANSKVSVYTVSA